MCQGEGKCLSQGGGNLGVGSSVDLLFFALIKGKVITVGPIHDKFNKEKKKKSFPQQRSSRHKRGLERTFGKSMSCTAILRSSFPGKSLLLLHLLILSLCLL